MLLSGIGPGTCFGQSISSVVIDAATKKPVSYASVAIPSKNRGTLTDEQGFFNLDGPAGADSLVVSMIGYTTRSMAASGLPKQIELQRSALALAGVTVKPAEKHTRMEGNKFHWGVNTYELKDPKAGEAVGTLMPAAWPSTFLKKVCFNLSYCAFDSVLLRLNVFERVNDSFYSVLNSPVYLNVHIPKNNKVRIDVSDHQIVVHHEFLLALEIVKDPGKGSMVFCGNLTGKGCPTYIRGYSGSPWQCCFAKNAPFFPVGIFAMVSN